MSPKLRNISICLATICSVLAPNSISADSVFTEQTEFLEALSGGSTTINFDSLPHQTVVTDQFAEVDFNATATIYDEQSFPSGGAFHTPPNVLLNSSPPDPIEFDFVIPVDGVGFFNTSIVDRLQVTLFSSEGEMIFTGELPEGTVNFLGVVCETPIAYGSVVGIPPETFGTIFIDTFSYGTIEQLVGDVNCDGFINLLDVAPFVNAISTGEYDPKADINADGNVNLLDVQPFVDLLSN